MKIKLWNVEHNNSEIIMFLERIFKPNITYVLALLSLSGCIAGYPHATGPLNLSASVENGLREWSSRSNPMTFALTLDGHSYGYSYCSDIKCSGNEDAVALYSCEKMSKGSHCVIYARDG
jgi:hypothetical protein